MRRARAVALVLEEERCACAKARYAASRAVASLEGASALLLRLCVWPCGLHSTQSTRHRWWCLVSRARAVALGPQGGEVRVCESTVRGLSVSCIAGRSECTAAAAVCAALRPAQHAEHSPQVVVLGEEGSSCCSCHQGGEVHVCESTVRGPSGSSIAGRSECTAAAAVCGLAACTAQRALTTGGGA